MPYIIMPVLIVDVSLVADKQTS